MVCFGRFMWCVGYVWQFVLVNVYICFWDFMKGLFASLAEKLIKEFEENVKLRKRFAELLVSEPDIRLVMINAFIAV